MKTTFIDFEDIKPFDKNKILTGSIIPRPIAWISSINENDTLNLAPFSFFSIVANDVFSVSFTQKKSGGKDTLRNILRTKEAVIHSASIKNLNLVNDSSSEDIEYGVSEVDMLNLKLNNSNIISTPYLEVADIAFETKLIQHIPLTYDSGKPKSDIVLLQVVGVHINKDIYNEEKNYIDGRKLDPASRLAGKLYGKTIVEESITRD